MKLSVIYSVDCPATGRMSQFMPTRTRRHFYKTEGNESYDLDHLEGDWKRGKHRKLCAVLTRPQFDAFVRETGLYATRENSLGSLGAPGFGPCRVPNVLFDAGRNDAIMEAAVTLVPARIYKRDKPLDKSSYARLKRAFIKRYE